jgi:hypothetical protein
MIAILQSASSRTRHLQLAKLDDGQVRCRFGGHIRLYFGLLALIGMIFTSITQSKEILALRLYRAEFAFLKFALMVLKSDLGTINILKWER